VIRVSKPEASLLFNDWRDRGIWLSSLLLLREDGTEEHKFWAKIAEVSSEKLSLTGEYGFIELPLEDGVEMGYAEVTEAPATLRSKFSEFEFCFTIRSKRVVAYLFGQGPKNE
jgi:hypothetical protein